MRQLGYVRHAPPRCWYLDLRPHKRIYGIGGKPFRTESHAVEVLGEIRKRAAMTGSVKHAIQAVCGTHVVLGPIPVGTQLPWQERYRRRMLTGAKQRAKDLGVPFSITVEDVVIPEKCPALGIELLPTEAGAGRQQDSAPSLDRISPSRGYVPGNVMVISWRANRIKSNFAAAELQAVASWLEYVERVPPITGS